MVTYITTKSTKEKPTAMRNDDFTEEAAERKRMTKSA